MSQNIYVDRTLQFNKGGGGASKIVFDTDDSTTILYILPETDATEYIAFGNATKNMDVKFFGDTSGSYAMWDESANAMVFNVANIDTDATTGMKIGTVATRKIGFFGATPVVRRTHITDATGVDAVPINAILTALETLGLVSAT